LPQAAKSRLISMAQPSLVDVTRAEEAEHTDPAIAQFLALIEQDITAGKNVAGLPAPLVKNLKKALKLDNDLAEEIQGNVSL
jgi:antitoxin PrlF